MKSKKFRKWLRAQERNCLKHGLVPRYEIDGRGDVSRRTWLRHHKRLLKHLDHVQIKTRFEPK